MADSSALSSFAELRLNAEEREKVAEVAGDLIAVHVYRELQRAGARASDSGCNIIGNCSSSSKSELLGRSLAAK
jgi:hypothetical protein